MNTTVNIDPRTTYGPARAKPGIWRGAPLLLAMLFTMVIPGIPSGAEGGGPFLYVFSSTSEKVTIIDTATQQVLGTRPTGFMVKWLADNMNSFDGRLLWTYGLRTVKVGEEKMVKVDVIAFDPIQLKVIIRTEVGNGPAHSVVLTPDRK